MEDPLSTLYPKREGGAAHAKHHGCKHKEHEEICEGPKPVRPYFKRA